MLLNPRNHYLQQLHSFHSGLLLQHQNELLSVLRWHSLCWTISHTPFCPTYAVLVLGFSTVPESFQTISQIQTSNSYRAQLKLFWHSSYCDNWRITKKNYFSLFDLDFSKYSLSRGDDLNLASASAYFFWFSSGKEGQNDAIWHINHEFNAGIIIEIIEYQTVEAIEKVNFR
jgi:hypothetical protein